MKTRYNWIPVEVDTINPKHVVLNKNIIWSPWCSSTIGLDVIFVEAIHIGVFEISYFLEYAAEPLTHLRRSRI